MCSVEDYLQKYILSIDNYKGFVQDNTETPEWYNKVTQEDYWKKLCDLNFDQEQFKTYIDGISDTENIQNYFDFGLSCFVNFIQANFTGPSPSEYVLDLLKNEMFDQIQIDYTELLSIDNEDINVNTKHPVLLVAAKIIFKSCLISPVINLWWQLRLIYIHQRIFEEASPSFLADVNNLCQQLAECVLEDELKALLHVEIAQVYLMYRHVSNAKKHINSATEILGLEYKLVGKLGKRTKYQQNEIAQLGLEANLITKEGLKRSEVEQCDVPTNVLLNDEVRLENVEFLDTNQIIKFPKTEQKLLITIVNEMLISKPIDELDAEEVRPFVDFILSQQNTWSVCVVALLLRCKLEEKTRRTIERCFLQCEEIISSFSKESPSALYRVADIFGAGLCPIWKVQELYAKLLLNVGLVKNSLDIHLQIKLWEEVIICYTLLQLRHKAVEVIMQQLEERPTVKLWCLLGDATDDINCYEKAWLMSEERSHRAQRHWGNYLFDRKLYEESIPHYEKSLSINPLQEKIWFRLAFAAHQTENWQTAAAAYRRYTTLEPEGFEAWNNLAQAYIKLGNKRNAHQALLEALKCNFDHWRVWENLIFVSCDIAHFSDVLRAYHRILDLQGKYLNAQVLNVLVLAVTNNLPDYNGEPSNKYLLKTRELLGRVTPLYPGEGELWMLYGALAPNNLIRAQRYQRAYRGYTPNGWDKDPESCKQVLKLCKELGEVSLEDDVDPKDTLINSIRLNLNSALAASKKQSWEGIEELIEEVSVFLQKILDKIKNGTSTT